MTKPEVVINQAGGSKFADRFSHLAFGHSMSGRYFFQVEPAFGGATQQTEAERVSHNPDQIGGVLDVMGGLAESGMTMLCVTHEMGFARRVANRVIFMDEGQIIEENEPNEFFNNPQNDRTKLFLSQILSH